MNNSQLYKKNLQFILVKFTHKRFSNKIIAEDSRNIKFF